MKWKWRKKTKAISVRSIIFLEKFPALLLFLIYEFFNFIFFVFQFIYNFYILKVALLVDDMADTCGTICLAAEKLVIFSSNVFQLGIFFV